MVSKRLVTLVASIAMVSTPVMAAGPSAAPSQNPAPVTGASTTGKANGAVNTRVENVRGMKAIGGRRDELIIGGAIVAAALAICFGFAVCTDSDNPPASP